MLTRTSGPLLENAFYGGVNPNNMVPNGFVVLSKVSSDPNSLTDVYNGEASVRAYYPGGFPMGCGITSTFYLGGNSALNLTCTMTGHLVPQ